MSGIKSLAETLAKFNIEKLNPMQEDAFAAISCDRDVVLLSPTGSGKTLAFLLPIVQKLDRDKTGVQALIIAPTRELVIQIEQVLKDMGSGFKTNAAYGGRSFNQDKLDLKKPPAILVGTPGRVADHLRRQTFAGNTISILVLDEFDKSLEVGFESEMKEILAALPSLSQRVLTSATQNLEIPDFTGLKNSLRISHLADGPPTLQIKLVHTEDKDKLEGLATLLADLGQEPGIVFCNFKDSIERVSSYLAARGFPHGIFQGGMEQQDRERALIKFRNGTHRLLLATDLAARGIDVPEIKFIIHYHLPLKSHEFTHRNGRTARMHNDGTAYVLQWKHEQLPDFIEALNLPYYSPQGNPSAAKPQQWETLFISGGRRDKISKGDIAGLFLKQGNLQKEELGLIEIKQDCAFVAVPEKIAHNLISKLDNSRLKKKKVRVRVV